MYLRWSLAILSLSSFVYTSRAVPIPAPGGSNDPKAPSKTYRGEAEHAPYGFQLSPGGTTVDRFHEQGQRPPRPQEDADHLLEAQTLHHALRAQGHEYRNLPAHHQAGLRQILNDRTNMAFIDRSLNRGKGQVVRHGNDGRQLAPNPGRDAYTRATVPNAVHTAGRLDSYLTQHGYRGNVRETHTNTMRNAGVLGHHETTPENTPAHHAAGQAGPGPGTLAHRMGALNLHGTGHGHSSSHSASSSSSGGSPPHSPTPFRTTGAGSHHHAGGAPSTPPHHGTHDPHLGSHAPRADRTHPGIFGPIPPLPRLGHAHDAHDAHDAHGSHPHSPTTPPPHHGHGGVPQTPAHQTGTHADHHALGHNAPPRPLVRSNSFGGTPSRPLLAPHNQPHTPPSPSHGHGPAHKP